MTTRKKEEISAATAALAGHDGFSLISNEKLIELYRMLVRCRNGNAGSRSAWLGCEAALVGVAADLTAEDTVVYSGAGFPSELVKGGARRSRPIGDAIEAALNAAEAHLKDGKGRIAVLFAAEGQGSAALWVEAISKAAAGRLPVIFVSQSGEGAPPISEEIAQKAAQCELPAIPVDGSDLVAIYRVATESLGHARKGNGATFIGCGETGGAEAIAKMEAYLDRKGLFSQKLKREVAAGK